MAKVGRNEACPCGSGKKFKHCHYGREGDLEPAVRDQVTGPLTPLASRGNLGRALIPGLVAALVLGVAGGLWRGGPGLGIGVTLGVLLGLGWALMQDPPPPRDTNQGSSINFGQ